MTDPMTPDERRQLADRLDNIADQLDLAHHREDVRATAGVLRATASDPDPCPKCLGRKDDGMGARVVEVEGREVLAILKCEACDGTGRATASNNPTNTDAYPDLVLQLRSLSDRSCNAAADIIEQLAAERDAARAQMQSLTEDFVAMEARAITAEAERDAAVARAVQLGTDIDSVRSCWHANEGPRWTANVIEALRHSGLMDAAAVDRGTDR